MQINIATANENKRKRNTAASLQRRFGARRNMQGSDHYNYTSPLKDNYLGNLGIVDHGAALARRIRQGDIPSTRTGGADGSAWGESPAMFQEAMTVASEFDVGFTRNAAEATLFSKAFAEFMMEMEKVIQHRLLDRGNVVDSLDDRHRSVMNEQLARSVQRMYTNGRGDIQSLTELGTRTTQFRDTFWSNQSYKEKWASDFRSLMDDSIKMILKTFAPNPAVSFFGELIPNLREYIPAGFIDSPRHRRPKGYIYRMDGNRDFLRIIFNIMMVRLPVTNTAKKDVWKNFSLPIVLHRIRQAAADGEEEGDVMEDSYMSNATILHTDTSLKNLFYYIPQQERVIGLWPKTVRVNRGGEDMVMNNSTLMVNYNTQMVRSVLCKILLSDADRDSRIHFAELFQDPVNNFYTRIRRMDPIWFW
jgi:hypothetical protein